MSALDVVRRCLDLTSLRGDETDRDIEELCDRAAQRGAAAVVVFPQHVSQAQRALDGTYVKVATVAGDFPGGTASLDDRLFDVRRAVDEGPDEVDVVIDRRLVTDGKLERVRDQVAMMREIVGDRPLKVIVESAELGSREAIGGAALAVCAGGADFVKTSTGFSPAGGATPEAVRAVAAAVRAFEERSGSRVGVKVSGGIRSDEIALGYVALVEAALGPDWLTPGSFRIGSSSLLGG